eukprot:1155575-Pelagomonas_calceolata.AAC.1
MHVTISSEYNGACCASFASLPTLAGSASTPTAVTWRAPHWVLLCWLPLLGCLSPGKPGLVR